MGFTVREISPAGAAEIVGLDCRHALAPEDMAALRRAFHEHPILAIRDQPLTPPQQAAFARQFGPLVNEANAEFAHPDDDNVLIISNEILPDGRAVGVVDAGDAFHSDSSHRIDPVAITMLNAIRNPRTGGATEFINMVQVYAALPDDLKRAVDGRFAYHHGSKLRNKRVTVSTARPGAVEAYARDEREKPEVLQPMVRTHPETGRPALYVSPRFALRVDGMEEEASDALLDRLFAFMMDERFRYRHEWHERDLVLWDNRCLNHRATGGYALPDIRRMHRVTVAGEPAFYHPN